MMSALGHKQTLEQASEMSVLPAKADMRLAAQKCPLSAKSGREAMASPTRVPSNVSGLQRMALGVVRATRKGAPAEASARF